MSTFNVDLTVGNLSQSERNCRVSAMVDAGRRTRRCRKTSSIPSPSALIPIRSRPDRCTFP